MLLKTSEIYKKLYHYTTWSGLIGILQSQCLWATHYKFLNDSTEIILFKDTLVKFLLPEVRDMLKSYYNNSSTNAKELIDKKGGLDNVAEKDTNHCVNSHYKALYAVSGEIYITSFCGEHKDEYIDNHGLLSQWRGYGQDGGFSIVFDTKKLEKILIENDNAEANIYGYATGHLSNVYYSNEDDKYKEELSESLQDLVNHIKDINNNYITNKGKKADDVEKAKKAYRAFVRCITQYKHQGFKEENEVRIVALPTIYNQEYLQGVKETNEELKTEKPRKFRGKDNDIPYIELFKTRHDLLSLENMTANDITLPIERIIVGPHKDKEARAEALRVMLRNTGITVTVSDIPYIGR